MTADLRGPRDLVPHRQPGACTARTTLRPGRRAVAAASPTSSARPPSSPSAWSGSRCSPTPDAIRRACLDANADDRVHRRDRLDAHVLAGQDVDRRARRAAQAAAAPAHAVNVALPWADDRHGLHEPQPGRARRPRVRATSRRGSASPARPSPATSATRDVAQPGRRPGRGRPPGGTSCARCKLARFGDNMRDVAVTEGDKVEAQLRFGVSVNTYGVNDLVDRRRRGAATPRSTTLVEEYERQYDVAPELRAGGERHESLRYARPHRGSACAPFLDRGRLRRLHHQLRGPRRAAPAARARGAAADGRRLRLRRRGRLEDLGAAARR